MDHAETHMPVEGPASKALEAVLESVDEAILLISPDGREIVGCNPAAERLFGYGRGELVGRSTRSLHVDRRRFEAFVRLGDPVLRQGEPFRIAWEMRRKDGTVFPCSHVVSLVDESLGLGGGVVSIVRDRSRMGGALAVLEELEQRFRVLFDENPEGMLVYDVESRRLLAVNRALAALYGRVPRDLVGRDAAELILEEERPRLLSFLEAGARDDPRISRWRVRRADGAVRRLRVSSRPVVFEGRAARLAVATDVTEREQAEQVAQRLSAILDASPDFVGIALVDLEIEYINPAGRRLLDLPPGMDLAKLEMHTCFTPESWRLIQEQGIPEAVRGGTWRGETVFSSTRGEEIPASQVIIAHRGSDGEVEFLSAVARDMREHLELEQQLRQAQKMEAVGRLAGGIAHDFNNILTALAGYAELARTELDDPAAARNDLDEIVRAAERAADLTGQLLAFSRQQVLEPRVVVLDDVLREVETMLHRTLGERVRLETRLGSGTARIEVDPAQLQQVVLNLAINARDAMPEGGRLTFETEPVRIEHARPGNGFSIAAGDYVVLRVSDTGDGMDEATRARIFEPFFTTKEAGEGTGLGLSTVYGIVKQSGGYIEVESAPGAGTTFTVHLPRSEHVAQEPAPRRPRAAARTGRETILVAEDDEPVRGMIRRTLESAGYTVVAAAGGEEALALHERGEAAIDLAVTDVVMRRMTGQELVRELRRDHGALPVVYISGYFYSAMGGKHRPEESAVFLPKPFSPQALLQAVRDLLDRSSANDAPGS